MKVVYVGLATLGLAGCVPEPDGYGGYGGYGGSGYGRPYGAPAYVEPGYRGGYGPGPVVVVPGRDRYQPERYDRQRADRERYERDRRRDDNRRGPPPSAPPPRFAAPPQRPSGPPPQMPGRSFAPQSAPGPATEPGAGHPTGPN